MNVVRIYNQNRRKIWKAIIIIASIIILIQLLNYWAGLKNKVDNNMDFNNNISINYNYNSFETNASSVNVNSSVSGGVLKDSETEKHIKIISEFVDYCNSGEISLAYNLISDECKKVNYQSEEDFKKGYYNNIFTEEKKYNIEAWDLGRVNVYKVIFTQDILVTGNINSLNYEDYINVVQDNDGKEKLNIGGYVYRKEVNGKVTSRNVVFRLNYIDVYQEYSIYNLTVQNQSDEKVILDNRDESNGVYIIDNNGIKSYALIEELTNKQTTIFPNNFENMNIKFNTTFRSDRNFSRLCFSNCNISGEKEVINIEL